MKIAYNPKTAAALTAPPLNNDITFDLKGVAIYARGVKFEGTDTTYSVFKKHTSNNSGGYDGLVPVPSYNNNSITRFLREDGSWIVPTNTTYLYIGAKDAASNAATTNGNTYIKLFDNTTLRHLYLLKGSGITTVNSDANGNITINTPANHNLPTSDINALTEYAIADRAEDLVATDTLNIALGKLEYKLNIAYDLVTKANDNDGTIENLKEILDVLSGISDTDTIKALIGKYLPLAGGTMLGHIKLTTGSSSIRTADNIVLLAHANSNSYSGVTNGTDTVVLGNTSYSTLLRSNDTNLVHYKSNTAYDILDASNYTLYTPILNSASTHATRTSVIYAPTSSGTKGLILLSDGPGAPVWANTSSITVGAATNGVFYIEGTGSNAGTWLGEHTSITSYYKGLTIAYKIPIAGSSTTTLNINGLGAKTVMRNTGNLTTHLPVGTTVILVYDGSYFRWADYNDGNNKVSQYITDTTNAEYPLLFRYNTNAPSNDSYVTEYTRYDSAITINPNTNTITTPGIVKTNELIITKTTNGKHILFSRGSDTDYPYNYIAAPTGGIISILPNGVENSSANGMQFSSNGLHPGTNLAYSLGTATLRWNNVYAANFHGNADSASKLTTVSKTAWGQTYWTSGGVPTSISGDIKSAGNIWIPAGNNDKYITFTSSTSNVDAGNSWRIGYLGTGSGDENLFVLLSTQDTTEEWTNALSITNETLAATFAGPVTANHFISGSGTNDFSAGIVKLDTLHVPTSSGGSTYGAGSDGLVLKSNGTTVYWASDSNSDTKVTQTITTVNANYRVLFSANANDTTETTTARKAANLLYNPSTGTLTTTTFNGTATKVTCTATTSDVDRPIVGTNTSNLLYYTTKATVNWSSGIIKAVGFLGNLIGGAEGSLIYLTSGSTTAFLNAPTTDGYVLKYNTSTKAPYWAADTDTKVTLTITTTSNTSWRPILIGYSYSDADPFAPSTVTNTVYATHLMKIKPSTGALWANSTITASGFVRSGSSDSYVLLGGGGHKALSDFLLESEFATKELSANLTTISKSLTVTLEWMDTGITGTDLPANGTYIIQVYVSNSTDSLYYSFWSGVVSWYKNSTNDTESDEILLHRSGHAYANTIYLRTVMRSSSTLKLLIAANKNLTTAATYTFKFKRII